MFDYSYKMNLLSDRIRKLKAETGWSNAELARRAGTSRAAPTDWLKDKVQYLSSGVAANLSNESRFCATWLATGEGPIYQSDAGPSNDWPFTTFSREQFDNLPERVKGRIEQAALNIIDDWEQNKSAARA